MAQRLVEIAIKARDESKAAFDSLAQSLTGGNTKALAYVASAAAIGDAVVVTTAQLYKFVSAMADTGDEMDKMSLRTGIAVDKLSELQFAAERGGGSIGDVETATRKLSRTMVDATNGVERSVDAFRKLGIQTSQLVGPDGQMRDLNDMWPLIADGLRDVGSQTERIDIVQELFGRGGTALLPMLQRGAEGIREMRREMDKYGGAMSGQFAAKSAQFADAQTNLANATARLKEALSEPFLSPFTIAVNTLARSIEALKVMPQVLAAQPGALGAYHNAWRAAGAASQPRQPGMYDPNWFNLNPAPVMPGRPVWNWQQGVPGSTAVPAGGHWGMMNPGVWNPYALEGVLASRSGESTEQLENLGLIMPDLNDELERMNDGMKLLTEAEINMLTASDNLKLSWELNAAMLPAFTSALDSAFYQVLTSTRSFGRAFVEALRMTFANVLANIGAKWVTNTLTGMVSGGGSGWDKTVSAANKSLPAPLGFDAQGRMMVSADKYYGKAFLA
jgi:hypothetical protein